MDGLWSKERLQKIFSKDTIGLPHASGDGDSPLRCCRLCAGDGNLKRFGETYVWEGVEERYDNLLYDCFGVRVQPTDSDGMICERCIRQLRMTQRFRALVQSAFARPPSELQSQLGIGEGFTNKKFQNKMKYFRHDLQKKPTRTTVTTLSKRKSEGQRLINANSQVKRMNITCTACKQKYPMIVPFEGWKQFVCSRCKIKTEPRMSVCKKCNALIPPMMMNDHLEMHAKTTNLRGKSRLFSVPKKPSQIPQLIKDDSIKKLRYQCNHCTKKYSNAQHLIQHVSSVHKQRGVHNQCSVHKRNSVHRQNIDAMNCVCNICNKDMRTQDMLDRHMRMHTGQPMYQCDVCMRIFKGKRSFQTHYLTHGK